MIKMVLPGLSYAFAFGIGVWFGGKPPLSSLWCGASYFLLYMLVSVFFADRFERRNCASFGDTE